MAKGEPLSFLAGLFVGFIASVPVAAWLSPRSGAETRESIRQQGRVVRRKAADAVLAPVQEVQERVAQIKGESVTDALEAGKALARTKQEQVQDSPQIEAGES